MNFNLLTQAAQIIPYLGIIIAFFTPARCFALIELVQATMAFVSALNNADPTDDYIAARNFLRESKEFSQTVLGNDPEINRIIDEKLIPFILGFIYAPGADDAEVA
jgi:hypothetical protein